jgi:hypothetical protein
MLNALCVATLCGLLNNFKYHLIRFIQTCKTIWFDTSELPVTRWYCNCKQSQAVSSYFTYIVIHISPLWYVDMAVTCFLLAAKELPHLPECWSQCSSFFNFLFLTTEVTVFLLACKVPTPSIFFWTSWTEPTLVNYKNCASTDGVHDQDLTILLQFLQSQTDLLVPCLIQCKWEKTKHSWG